MSILGIIFLIASYNNWLRGFGYDENASMKDMRKHQQDCLNYSKEKNENESLFENDVTDQLNIITDNHIEVNGKRTAYLFWAKSFIMACLLFTTINSILLIFKSILL